MKTTGQASRVIDGHRISTCSITKDEPGQWVKVDLLVPYKVTVIQLAYSEDCCYSDEVWVDHTRYIYGWTRLKECIAHYVESRLSFQKNAASVVAANAQKMTVFVGTISQIENGEKR